MRIVFARDAWEDYVALQSSAPELVGRVNAVLKDCLRDPFRGLGKPEPLKRDLAGWWSRRITQKHRLVYRVTGRGAEQQLEIGQCFEHY